MASYYVKALWDPEAEVFYSETDVPGLTVEARTLAEFQQLVLDLAPDMISASVGPHEGEVTIRFSAERELAVVMA